ncbi:LysM peptidoglycan-binding domain-containing protein [Aneurinibacillus aneurinilyticus]|jgi:3D (Asp-Asp-Asp) domain-containing protein|uniref:LysM domain protein n=1 Tax=Aneurinibacillus aneurinilyticus ATCC 12856 TaxID=649747 RepID=U1YF19_ANEAE|nr:LysM peptidoglycan-binding domain-containing protein [Aneurinibacillus aneurinilyticus]ERI09371.1 LysM domain protein [Aneurinibacillus aneurinilyticus ATCC 12856]MCI1694739.1 LysM peptidoglycan-binding domain-containing protein [Aneurinibacillus aneurinilyticus]MED0709145.1 LysM peptidoglycan-binding domain-containing protein [Aneurinibacillus aneurinilyticus]MED0724832.1 LysM peptidoglycan-binding domain-containing protein [Aneurinibacillus aneurinilyticus]MED0734596.1 LysM peptidoglycan-
MKKSILTGLLTLTACMGTAASASAAEAYTVKENDTLWKVEKNHKLPFAAVQKMNPAIDPKNLHIGTKLRMPETYTVVEGESLQDISKKVNIPVKELQSTNPNVNSSNIQGGTVLVLPQKTKVAKPKTKMDNTSTKAPSTSVVKTVDGKKLTYKRTLSSRATAYSAAPEENGGYTGIDYYGNELKVGTIAVDPDVIPLGSKVYITGYSFPGLPEGGMVAQATDIGGAIKNNRIDIFVPGSPAHVNKFGVQNVKIYVLK